ncbi:MAG: segregation/condensation protein A [Gammaproteobacteria bacterium]|nr:segregation/condensation protein A [Gammaproteobacteria bacterium]
MNAEPQTLAAADAPVVRVRGEVLTQLPEDLYIPPDALRVFLEAFEGPLDLLLYLIRKQNLDILDIPVLRITQQYMSYIELMREARLELAAEYLVMAAWLAEIKSRVLLPRPPPVEDGAAEDPRAELVRRLQEYERFKAAAESLEALPRVGREIFIARARPQHVDLNRPLPVPGLRALLLSLHQVLQRADALTRVTVSAEPLSVRARMARVLQRLTRGSARFEELFDVAEGRPGVVVALLAVIELARMQYLQVEQAEPFAPLRITPARAHAAGDELISDADQ